MHAVVKAGGHQYRVQEGDVLRIDRLAAEEGQEIKLDQVLMVGDKLGQPLVPGASVDVVVKSQERDPKITVFRFKRRKNFKVKRGHKQPISVVEVKKINA